MDQIDSVQFGSLTRTKVNITRVTHTHTQIHSHKHIQTHAHTLKFDAHWQWYTLQIFNTFIYTFKTENTTSPNKISPHKEKQFQWQTTYIQIKTPVFLLSTLDLGFLLMTYACFCERQ